MKPALLRPSAAAFDDEPRPSFLTELLFPLPATRRTTLGILTWWESRRLLYNVIVGSTGLVTLAVVWITEFIGQSRNSHTIVEARAVLPVLAFGALANICYTLGPIIEITLDRVWKDLVLPVGPALFRQGLAFSVGLTLLPIPLAITGAMVRLARLLFFRQ